MGTILPIKTALLEECQTFNGGVTFTADNSSLDDYRVVDHAPVSLVIVMGGPTIEGDVIDGYGTQGSYQERHDLLITVYLQVGTGESGPSTLAYDLQVIVEALKDHLRGSTLGGLARDMRSIQTSEVKDVTPRGAPGAPTHMAQEITMRVWVESEWL